MVVGSMTIETELLIIGAGPGGYVAAIRAAQLGKEVIIVEKEDALGGVCLNTGCIPTKALIKASNYYAVIKELDVMGIHVKDYELNFEDMKKWKANIISRLETGIRSLCKKHGVEIIKGKAVFKEESEVRIEGKSDVTAIKFKNCIIATGSRSIEIPGFPFSDPNIIKSRDAISLKEIPEELAIIGGGYIGTEMATVFTKLGSKVHIIELSDHLIPVLDKEIVSVVHEKLKSLGVKIHLQNKANSYETKEGKIILSLDKEPGKIEVNKVLVVVGRRPNTEELDLQNANVKIDEKGFIKVDETMKTTNEKIYAIGDVAGQPMLAHKANKQAKVAAEVISGLKSAFDNRVVPSVVFNDPEIASVGLTEDEAKQKGYDVVVGRFPFSSLGRALIEDKTEGFVKIISDKKTDLVLGVHAVGPLVSEVIMEATLAIELGATVEDIALTIHPHPTNSEGLLEAAEAVKNSSIHLFK